MKQAKRHFYYQGSLIRMYHNIPLETREREREGGRGQSQDSRSAFRWKRLLADYRKTQIINNLNVVVQCQVGKIIS